MRTIGFLVLFLASATLAQGPTYEPVGTVRQLMLGVIAPSSDVIFKIPQQAPKNEKEWAVVQDNALMLAEAGNLLMIPGRAKDRDVWVKNSRALVAAGAEAFKAANAKNAEALTTIGDNIEDACEACHAKYLPK